MERVAFLLEETNERVACLLNPESVVLRRVAGVSSRRSIGGSLSGSQLADDALLYTGGGMTEMFLNLLFDVALAETKTEVNDVRDMTSPLWNMAENSGSAKTYGEPPRVRFVWGKSWNIPGVITSVSEHLDYFDSTGTPLRSWIRMRFLRVIEPTGEDLAKPPPPPTGEETAAADILQDLQTRADVTGNEVKVHTYAAGERLDQLVRQQYGFYGHPALWRLVASYNNISDPLNIPSGTILQFPPLTDMGGKK